jgi:hypothetical protein
MPMTQAVSYSCLAIISAGPDNVMSIVATKVASL